MRICIQLPVLGIDIGLVQSLQMSSSFECALEEGDNQKTGQIGGLGMTEAQSSTPMKRKS